MTNTTEAKVIKKGDTVRSRWGEFNGTAWVVAIHHDLTAVVEMTNRARVWTIVDSLQKVEV